MGRDEGFERRHVGPILGLDRPTHQDQGQGHPPIPEQGDGGEQPVGPLARLEVAHTQGDGLVSKTERCSGPEPFGRGWLPEARGIHAERR